MSDLTLGRTLTDAELSGFHGGACEVTITRDHLGNVVKVTTTGDCSNVQVIVK
ncbi:hypothetical protein [Microbacterium sp.]|uniref:hypothetical protein n=1 Tax=Microbacterium sp. TaxID=51671 RepID=UPI0032219B57